MPDFLTVEDTMMRSMLTTRQLAQRWQTSERHVERKRRDGTGPRYVRMGEDKAVRYPPEEVEAWEAAQLVSSTSEEVAAGRRSHKVKTEAQHEGDAVSRPQQLTA